MPYVSRRGKPTWGTMARAAGLRLGGKRRRSTRSSSSYRKKSRRSGSFKKRRAMSTGRGRKGFTKYTKRASRGYKIVKAATALNIMKSVGALRVNCVAGDQGWRIQTSLRGAVADPHSLQSIFANAGITDNNRQLYIDSLMMEYKMVNQSNTQIKVILYDMEARRDIAVTDLDNNSEILLQTSFATVGIPAPQAMGVTPFMAGNFVSYWKIKKTRAQMLNPGQIITHNVLSKEQWKCNKWIFQKSTPAVGTIAKRTKALMIVIQGFPVNAALDKNAITFAPAGLNVVWNSTIKYYFTTDNSVNTTFVDNTVNNIAIAPVNPTVMNDDSGSGAIAINV